MIIEVISTGTELLRGTAVNSDLAIIGQALGGVSLRIDYAQNADDSRSGMIEALAIAAKRAEVIIITGGLGPTRDDITREVTAEFFRKPLVRDEKFCSYLRYLWRSRKGEGKIPGDYFRQGDRIGEGEFLSNDNGTAPGLYFSADYAGKVLHLFLLPGPPVELAPMVTNHLLPRLEKIFTGEKQFNTGFLIAGTGELEVQQRAESLLSGIDVELAYCATPEGTRIFISGAENEVRKAVEVVRGEFAFALGTGHLSLADEVVRLLNERKMTLGFAESCTGGLIASRITDVAGSSAVFWGGIVSYDNSVKINVLGVPEEVIKNHGAVSGKCAEAMAQGAKRVLNVDIAGSVTGIAGPGGGSAEKPVGTVFMAVTTPDGKVKVSEHHFRGDRQMVRNRTAAVLLLEIYKALIGY